MRGTGHFGAGTWVRGLGLALAAVVLVAIARPAAAADYSALVVDAATGAVLYERDADKVRFPASITKVMTLYLLFEDIEAGNLTLSDKLTVSANAAAQSPVKLGVRAGQTIKVKDAILALVTLSANDVAVVVAENLAVTEAKFARRMTERARELGMGDTLFRNASGLPNPDQVTTARDMVRLAMAVRRDFPGYYDFFSTRSFTYKGVTYGNHNKLLGKVRGVDGLKTGFTRAAGWNLAATAVRDGRIIVGIILGGESRLWRDARMTELLNTGFDRAKTVVASLPPLPDQKPGAVSVASLLADPSADSGAWIDENFATTRKLTIVTPSVDGSWGIQVGAYATAESASRALLTAETLLPRAFGEAVAIVIQADDYTTPLYRARYMGVDKDQAFQACAVLGQRNQPCAVVYQRSENAALPSSATN